MNCETAITLLDDRVDGLLDAAQTAALEAHLAGCPACAAELRSLQALLDQARSLPTDIEPDRDLWAGIAARIEPADRTETIIATPGEPTVSTPWYTRPRALALVAALLVGGTVAATRLLTPVAPAPSVAEQPVPGDAAPAPLPFPAWEGEMTSASAALGATLEARRGELQPETVAVIEDNLRIIDTAIEDCRAALAADPADDRLEAAMLSAWQAKVGLLERAAALPPNS